LRIGLDNALGIHPDALNLRAQRTEILARNIANADTPGYKSQDLDFHAVLQSQTAARQSGGTGSAQAQMARTHQQHMFDETVIADEPLLQYRMPLMPSLDGNTVEAQVEQAKFAENALQFQASLRFTNAKFRGLMTAIKGE
jgi:flagellar basal-body rod protein FlgB